jgi:mersacidin/lichenicidin family type 2 lantibiotic
MHDHATIRAWKDADYRQMLSAEDAAAAQSPAGTIELDDGDLGDIAG